ncbi:MAG: regulatory protein RecX [Lawsonibacter sp.]|nr:regulatory protein RecX [Lawsonibacter sp.]
MVIEELKPSKRVRDRWLAVLEDGSILRLSKNQIADFALYAGRELSDEEAGRLMQAIENENFRSYALRVVTDTPKSRKMLLKLLEKKGCQPEQAEEIAGWLEEMGLLNDRQYAADVVELYVRKGYGARKIRDELYRRGVPRELWDEALGQIGEEDSAGAIDAFLEKKLKGSRDPKDVKRASDALARRGYRWPEINDALRRYGMEVWD